MCKKGFCHQFNSPYNLKNVSGIFQSYQSNSVCSYHSVDTSGKKRDIVFLIDGSEDSRNGLPAIREFVQRMVNNLDIYEDGVRIAVVRYSDDATAYFNLHTHKTKNAIINAVRSLRNKGGRLRNTGVALQFVRNNIFTAQSGSRHLEGVPQFLFLLTGGVSSDSVENAASEIKGLGVYSFAIGMKNAAVGELQKIASSSRFLFNVQVFEELLSIQADILAFIQSKMEIEPPTIVGKGCHDSLLRIKLNALDAKQYF